MNFSNKFGDLSVKAKLSYLYENEVFESFESYGYDFGVKGIPSFDAIKEGQFTATSFQSQVVSNNFFGIAYLDYKDKYIFDGMFRYDGSSLFGSEERWQPYFRVSGAWRISEDIKIPGIDELKIRSAYGTAGQRPHLFAMQYEVMSIDGGISSKQQLGNKNLRPAKSAEFEVGLNIDFLKRFRFEVVYSKTTTDDQFLEVPLASHLGGWLTQWQNAGALESDIWEASLEMNLVNKKDFRWDARFVFDKGTSMITRLDVPPYQYGPEGQEANKCFYVKEGEKFGVMYGYDWVRTLDQMQAQMVEGDDINNYTVNSDGYVIRQGTEGTANEKPIKLLDEEGNALFGKIGDINPDFKLGFSNTITWKGLSLYFLLDWKQGGQIYNKSAQWLTRDDRHGMMDQFGKPENQKKAIPYYKEFYDVNSFNSFWVEDGTFLKLREVSVAYTIGQSALSKSGKGFIKGIKVGFIGRNLLTFTNYSGYDPEVMTTNGTQYFYYDFMGYPNYRSYSLSLELKF
ncbi:MAG TPA: TonB-dependent receptor [Prolixibacteraceae bacterium]|nr:TonB-dependent receptor [Prolixibacteraceae bacterium]